MVKTKKQKKRRGPKRRVHKIEDTLTFGIRQTIADMILGGAWPNDYGSHVKGKPRYIDIVAYCKKKGFKVSKSTIGRIAQELQLLPLEPITIIPDYNKPPEPRAERIRDYLLFAIAEEAQNFCNAAFDLQGCLIHPDDYPHAEHAIPRIRKQTSEKLAYIKQVIEDVQQLETAGSLVSGEAIKRSSSRPRANTERVSGQKPQTTSSRH